MERQTSWQQAKHEKIPSDPLTALKTEAANNEKRTNLYVSTLFHYEMGLTAVVTDTVSMIHGKNVTLRL